MITVTQEIMDVGRFFQHQKNNQGLREQQVSPIHLQLDVRDVRWFHEPLESLNSPIPEYKAYYLQVSCAC